MTEADFWSLARQVPRTEVQADDPGQAPAFYDFSGMSDEDYSAWREQNSGPATDDFMGGVEHWTKETAVTAPPGARWDGLKPPDHSQLPAVRPLATPEFVATQRAAASEFGPSTTYRED